MDTNLLSKAVMFKCRTVTQNRSHPHTIAQIYIRRNPCCATHQEPPQPTLHQAHKTPVEVLSSIAPSLPFRPIVS